MKKYVFLFISLCIFSSISPHVVRLSKIASWHELKDFKGALGISQPIKYYHIVTDVLPSADKVITFTAQDLIDIKKNQESMMPKVPWNEYVSPQSKEFCSLIQSNQRVSVLLKMPDSQDDIHIEVQSKVDKKKAILKSKIIKIRSLVENFNPDLISFMRGAFLELDSLWIAYSVIFFGVGSLVCQMVQSRREYLRQLEEKSWYTYYVFSEADEEFKNLYRRPGAVRYNRCGRAADSRRTKDYQEYLDGEARYKRAKEEYILKKEAADRLLYEDQLKAYEAERRAYEDKRRLEREREWQRRQGATGFSRPSAYTSVRFADDASNESRYLFVDSDYNLSLDRLKKVRSLYDILCVPSNRVLVIKFHPDKFLINFPGQDDKKDAYEECFKLISFVNGVLNDDDARRLYDSQMIPITSECLDSKVYGLLLPLLKKLGCSEEHCRLSGSYSGNYSERAYSAADFSAEDIFDMFFSFRSPPRPPRIRI